MTGFTLPGMIEEPGWRGGNFNSPMPQRGPDAIKRKSLAILINTSAVTFKPEEMSANTSVLFVASIKLSAVMNGSPTTRDNSSTTDLI